jgi:predicted  nucleic acid-binding Zn-ribbon protein
MSWTQEEVQFLLENYEFKGRNYCSEQLNRTIGSIASKARRLGLKSYVTRANKCAESYTDWLSHNVPDIIALQPYTLSSKPILHKHLNCGHEWKASPNNIKSGWKCPNCAPNKKITNEEYYNRLLSTEFMHLEEYSGTDTKILHIHLNCGHEWKVRPHDILRGQNCPKCSNKKPYSNIAIKWLDSFNNPNIIHAKNDKEAYLMGYLVDGFDPTTKTVYEFHGDVFHGNLDIFDEDDLCHPYNKSVTAGELWDATFDKMNKLSTEYEVIFIWEKDFKDGKTFERFNSY